MATGVLGLDPTRAEELCTRIKSMLNEFNSILQAVTTQVEGSMDVWWWGTDNKQFIQKWGEDRTRMYNLMGQMTQFHLDSLRKQINEQINASGGNASGD